MTKICCFLLALLPLVAHAQGRVAWKGGDIVLKNVVIYDGGDAAPARSVDGKPKVSSIRIENGLIVAINEGVSEDKAFVARHRGDKPLYVIPGLWDMHAHPRSGKDIQTYLGYGIVGLRTMDDFYRLNKITKFPEILTPAMTIPVSPYIAPTIELIANNIGPAEEQLNSQLANVSPTIETCKKEGVTFVKVRDFVFPEALMYLCSGTKAAGIKVAGHVPIYLDAMQATNAGLNCIEHMHGMLLACSWDRKNIREDILSKWEKTDGKQNRIQVETKFYARILETITAEDTTFLINSMKQHGTFFCPTLVTLQGRALADDPNFTMEQRMFENFFHHDTGLAATWQTDYFSWMRPSDYQTNRKLLIASKSLVGQAQQAGVRLLAGSDAPFGAFCFPGYSLHEELSLLVQSGLTPQMAIQTATRNPAEFFGLQNRGTIKVGNVADILVLTEDPLANIRNTREIWAVVAGGKFLHRWQLDEIASRDSR